MLHLRGHAHHLVTVLPESPQLRHPPSSRRLVGRRKIGEPEEIPADLAEEALAEAGEEEAAPLLPVPPGAGGGRDSDTARGHHATAVRPIRS